MPAPVAALSGRFRPAVAAVAVAAALAPRPAAAAGSLLEFEGNVALVDQVYLAALQLPADAAANPTTAFVVEKALLGFLRRAGYALATVEAEPVGSHIHVTIDEGRLTRIVVRGRDAVSTVAVRLQLDLPYNVFNRYQLERLLQQYRDDGAVVRYELLPVREVHHSGLQIDPLALVPGGAPLPPESAYELHIDFGGTARRGGLTLLAGIDPDSLRAGGVYTGLSGIVDGDRWEIEAQVGFNYFQDLERGTDELHFSRALGDARWLAPSVLGRTVRPTVRFREDLLRRQRQDLLLQSYWWNRLELGLGVSVEPRAGVKLSGELGVQQRDLFAIEQLDGDPAPSPVGRSSALRWFASLGARLVFDPDRLRVDRRHRLDVEVRPFSGLDGEPFGQVDAEYRKVFEFGWNDLWLHLAATGLAGSFDVTDAIPMAGRYLRGLFGHALYLDRVASFGVDYRLSLTRDIFKIGVYHDIAAYREAPGGLDAGEIGAANSFGPSFHALVLDSLELDLFYSAGFLFEGREFQHGVSLRVEKAF